jgi:hypothetical protein
MKIVLFAVKCGSDETGCDHIQQYSTIFKTLFFSSLMSKDLKKTKKSSSTKSSKTQKDGFGPLADDEVKRVRVGVLKEACAAATANNLARRRKREEAFGLGAVGHAYVHGLLSNILDPTRGETDISRQLQRALDACRTSHRDPINFNGSPSLLHALTQILTHIHPLILPEPPIAEKKENEDGSIDSLSPEREGEGGEGDDENPSVELFAATFARPLNRIRESRASTVRSFNRVRQVRRDAIADRLMETRMESVSWRIKTLFVRFLNNGADPNVRNAAGDPLISVLVRIVCHTPASFMTEVAYDLLHALLQYSDRGLDLCCSAATSPPAYAILYNTPLKPPPWLPAVMTIVGPWTTDANPRTLAELLLPKNRRIGTLLARGVQVARRYAAKTVHIVERAVPNFPPETCETVVEFLCGDIAFGLANSTLIDDDNLGTTVQSIPQCMIDLEDTLNAMARTEKDTSEDADASSPQCKKTRTLSTPQSPPSSLF